METTEVGGASFESSHSGHAAASDSLLDHGLTAGSDAERIHATTISIQNTSATTTTMIPATTSSTTIATTTPPRI